MLQRLLANQTYERPRRRVRDECAGPVCEPDFFCDQPDRQPFSAYAQSRKPRRRHVV